MLLLSEWSIVHYSNVAAISNKQKHIDQPNNIPNVLKPHFAVNLRDRNRPLTKFTISHTITNTINFKSKTKTLWFILEIDFFIKDSFDKERIHFDLPL